MKFKVLLSLSRWGFKLLWSYRLDFVHVTQLLSFRSVQVSEDNFNTAFTFRRRSVHETSHSNAEKLKKLSK